MNKLPSIDNYVYAAAKVCKVEPAELGQTKDGLGYLRTRRGPVLPRARELCIEAAYLTGRFGLPTIAKTMGLPNHSTAITARDRLRRQKVDGKYPPDIALQLEMIEHYAQQLANQRTEDNHDGPREERVRGWSARRREEQPERPAVAPERPGTSRVVEGVETRPLQLHQERVPVGTPYIGNGYGKAAKRDRK